MSTPTLSIVVPVYNRERLIARCLKSILQQDLSGCEIIVIDDESEDRTVEILESYGTAIRLIRNERNVGVLRARQIGIDQATGDWAVFVDSDDELVPNALSRIRECLADVPPDIPTAMFRCQMDDGSISPDPMPVVDELDYLGYLRFLERLHGGHHDLLYCVRPLDYSKVPHNEFRLEDLHCFDLHKTFKARVFPEIVRLYHQDSGNQLSKGQELSQSVEDISNKRRDLVSDRARTLELLITRHGAALRRYAPRVFHRYASGLAVIEFGMGRRQMGIRYGLRAIGSVPWSYKSWAVLIIGMSGMMNAFKTARARLQSNGKS